MRFIDPPSILESNMSQILNQQGTLSLDDLQVSQWFNSEALTTEKLNGRVVVVHAFQMLCPAA